MITDVFIILGVLNNMKNYKNTIYACFVGYVVQAIINNFVPLLFLTFEKTYKIPLSQITMLITFNFGRQLFIDLLSAKFVDRIGYRVSPCLIIGMFFFVSYGESVN